MRIARHATVVIDRPDVGDRHRSDLARKLGARDGVDDAPRVNQRIGRVELLETLEEERPLLREKERKALVHRHLADIRFHLREVGVHGSRRAQVLRDSPTHVHANLRVDVLVAIGGR